jgi:uncharacterized protein YlbG (UPF0298 family)
MKKLLKNKFIIALTLCAALYGFLSLPPRELWPLIGVSRKVEKEYDTKLQQAFEDGKDEVYLKDLVTVVPWTVVCSIGGYENSYDMVEGKAGHSIKQLQAFGSNPENKYLILFINNQTLAAFIETNTMYRVHTTECATKQIAKEKFFSSYIHRDGVTMYEKCQNRKHELFTGNSNCNTVFLGDRP